VFLFLVGIAWVGDLRGKVATNLGSTQTSGPTSHQTRYDLPPDWQPSGSTTAIRLHKTWEHSALLGYWGWWRPGDIWEDGCI